MLAELHELCDAHHGPMQDFSAKVVSQTAVSRLSGHYNMQSRGHAALVHSGFTALVRKNARRCGLLADVPLGFRSQDLPSAPIRLLKGPCATPHNSTTEPVVDSTATIIVPASKSSTRELVAVAMPDTRMPTLSNSTTEPVFEAMLVATAQLVVPSNSMKKPLAEVTPIVTVPALITKGEVTLLPEVPATLPPQTDTRDLPAGFEKLPLEAPTRHGITHGTSVKITQDPVMVQPAPVATPPTLIEEVTPLATPVVTRESRINFGNLSYAQNPQLAANMLNKLPGHYHIDPTVGFHWSPRIDNLGPFPAMLINGRVVKNRELDCGAETIITGQSGAAAMEITVTMIKRDAIVI
jgi:hypothetical protein